MSELNLLRQVNREADQYAGHARSLLRDALNTIECALNREDDEDQFWLEEARDNLKSAMTDIDDAIRHLERDRGERRAVERDSDYEGIAHMRFKQGLQS